MKRFIGGFAFAVALALLLGAVASLGNDDGASRTAVAGDPLANGVVDLRGKATGGSYPEVAVQVLDNAFDGEAIRIDPGVRVVWRNRGRVPHDIVPVDPSQFDGHFGEGATHFTPGKQYEYTFDKAGTYEYFCSLHGTATAGMRGIVVVGDGAVSAGDETNGNRRDAGTLRVPSEYPTIQQAVDHAAPGALVLVSPGVYHEAVTVTSDDIVIRGLDREKTVLDGQFRLDNGFKVLADGVAIENMTAQNFTTNGFFWTGVKGYRGSYLNAIRNGDYGIYAFDSTVGQFDHSYSAGSPDAGYYIGQCYPCDATIDHVIAEWNGLGYSGTNAGGNLVIANSEWRENRAGIVPNSGTGEKLAPQHGATIVGNRVHDNNNASTASIEIAEVALGNGILLAGGSDNVVERNLVYNHDVVGIGVTPLPETLLRPDDKGAKDFDARRNTVRDNVVRGSGAADLASITTIADAKDGGENCFAGNTFATSLPDALETSLPCGASASGAYEADLARFGALLLGDKPGAADYRKVVLPPLPPEALVDMPDVDTAPPAPANRGVPAKLDVDAVTTPAG
jgi:plastocyanin